MSDGEPMLPYWLHGLIANALGVPPLERPAAPIARPAAVTTSGHLRTGMPNASNSDIAAIAKEAGFPMTAPLDEVASATPPVGLKRINATPVGPVLKRQPYYGGGGVRG